MGPSIVIPDEAVPGLVLLASLNQEVFDLLTAAFEKVSACSSRKELTRQVRSFDEKLRKAPIRDIVDVVIGLYTILEEDIPVEFVVEALSNGIEEAEGLKNLSDTLREELKGRIDKVLSIGGGLALISKAAEVTNDHEKSFSSVRILTDLRPLFGDKTEAAPIGFSILHTLKLVFQEDFVSKEVFVVLNPTELQTLDKCVQRAKEKEQSLTNLLKETKLQLIK